MAMYNLPRPPLDFGSDNRGFTDPLRYSSQKGAPPSGLRHDRDDPAGERSRSNGSESLPGVGQLLTPANPSSVPPPLPPPPTSLSQYQTAHTQENQPSLSAGHAYPSTYHQLHHQPAPHFAQDSPQHRDGYAAGYPPSLQTSALPSAHASNPSPNSTSYAGYPAPTHQGQYLPPGQPQAIAPIGYPSSLQQQPHQQHRPSPVNTPSFPQSFPSASPVQYYPDTGPLNVSTDSGGSPERSERSPENAVKLQPRVLREDILPGEGPVWVYEDGSTCPKIIDGEPVNAEWGITKAGKPRKRLAIACTTCREKKIKCQPRLPKCAQCEKFGRECRYATAPRIQHGTPETLSYEFQAHDKPMNITSEPQNRALLPSAVKPEASDDLVLAKRRNLYPDSNEIKPATFQVMTKQSKSTPSKKPRSDLLSSSLKSDRNTITVRKLKVGSTPSVVTVSGDEIPPEDPQAKYEWHINPYEIAAKVTSHYMDMYFVHVNAAGLRLFPRLPFVRWLENKDEKSPNDLMLMYAMLALGSIFSARRDRKIDGCLFVKVARTAVEQSQHKYSLQLVQSRIILGYYYLAIGETPGGWDFIGQGLRVALGLNLNTEKPSTGSEYDDKHLFGLNSDAVDECRRRTYWSAYIADRCALLHSDHVPMLQSPDSFLRLPCNETIYHRQKPSIAPYFDGGTQKGNKSVLQGEAAVGPMAYLVNISSILGDVSTFIYRHTRAPAREYASSYETYYREMLRRLSDWRTSLPEDMEYTPLNASSSIENGRAGLFLECHVLYHTIIMKINRILRYTIIQPIYISRNFHKARKQAFELLKMMEVVVAASRSSKNTLDTSGNLPEFPDEALESCSPLAGSTPLIGFAILRAIDILSAGGSITSPEQFRNLTCAMNAGLAIVDELSHCWASALKQKEVILKRIESLCGNVAASQAQVVADDSNGHVNKETETRAKVAFWRYRTAMDATILQHGQDIFYHHHYHEDPNDNGDSDDNDDEEMEDAEKQKGHDQFFDYLLEEEGGGVVVRRGGVLYID